MKHLLLIFITLLFTTAAFAQGVGISSSGSAPVSCAMLDLSGSTKGFLPPRMTYEQRNLITSPVAGLIVWCNDCGPSGEMQVHNGTIWTNIVGGTASGSSKSVIGDTNEGDNIAYSIKNGDPEYPGQGVGINSTGSSPEICAMLDVSSSSKGFLPPRLTHACRNIIPGPVAGLIIWYTENNGSGGELQVYNGTVWTNMIGGTASGSSGLEIGDFYEGGKIAYFLQDGDPGYRPTVVHGIIAATQDFGMFPWGCNGTPISGADGIAIGTGNQNSIDIVTGCTIGEVAARICLDATVNGYSDWYLPSLNELSKLALNRNAIGGFVPNGYYWSSSEINNNSAWCIFFSNGYQYYGGKSNPNFVRPVRAF